MQRSLTGEFKLTQMNGKMVLPTHLNSPISYLFFSYFIPLVRPHFNQQILTMDQNSSSAISTNDLLIDGITLKLIRIWKKIALEEIESNLKVSASFCQSHTSCRLFLPLSLSPRHSKFNSNTNETNQ